MAWFNLLRPQQWIKNWFIFAALVFSVELWHFKVFLICLAGFALFCLAASSIYIFNDLRDREKDRLHYRKKYRPLASGAVSVKTAWFLFVILSLLTLAGSFYLSWKFALIVLLYWLINLAYSVKLKHLPIIDIMCLASGFVLRVLAGALLINCYISPWIIICTLLLALFLGAQKRRAELELVESGCSEGRSVLAYYNKDLLRDMASICASAAIMAYCLYSFNSEHTIYMMLTIPFVIYGIFRFQFLMSVPELAEAPDKAMVKDLPLLLDFFLWAACSMVILYWF